MSQAPSTYNRKKLEKYYTPAWVTDLLLTVESFSRPVLDPFAGEGHMIDALKACGIDDAFGWDIAPDRDDIIALDFREVKVLGRVDLVSNPPYGVQGRLALKLIKHALELLEPHAGKMALLLPADWDSGSTRVGVFGDHPAFAARYVLNRRIRWANLEGQKYTKSGRPVDPTVNHTWFVWDWMKDPKAPATAGYL